MTRHIIRLGFCCNNSVLPLGGAIQTKLMTSIHYSVKIGKSASGLPKIKIPGFATLKPFILDPKFSCSKREGKPTTSEKFKI